LEFWKRREPAGGWNAGACVEFLAKELATSTSLRAQRVSVNSFVTNPASVDLRASDANQRHCL